MVVNNERKPEKCLQEVKFTKEACLFLKGLMKSGCNGEETAELNLLCKCTGGKSSLCR